MIVADASVVVSALERDGPARMLLVAEDVHVPHVADQEILQALRGQVMRGWVTLAAAESRLARWRRLGVGRHSAAALLPRMWALRDDLTAYDATYVALAEALECPLATGDLRLARAPGVACEVVRVAA